MGDGFWWNRRRAVFEGIVGVCIYLGRRRAIWRAFRVGGLSVVRVAFVWSLVFLGSFVFGGIFFLCFFVFGRFFVRVFEVIGVIISE